MNNPRLAGRYAKSLLDLATELNQVSVIYGDMKMLQSICRSNRDFTLLLRSPIVKPSTKAKIIESVIGGRLNATTASFINLLVRKGRESNLPEIIEAFIEQYNKLNNIYRVKLTTAVPVGDDVKNALVNKIKSETPMKNIELETAVKEELIGGFVLEMEDLLVDTTILRDLKDIKKQFMDNEYIHKIR